MKSAHQATKMREVRDSFLRAGDPEEELQRRIDDDEDAGGHRNRRKDQHHAVVRKVDRVGEQQAEHPAGSAHGRIHDAGQRRGQQLRDPGRQHAHQVVSQVAAGAENPLDRPAEHVQREHVEADMHQAAVQEGVGQQLPGLESGAQRPERERTAPGPARPAAAGIRLRWRAMRKVVMLIHFNW